MGLSRRIVLYWITRSWRSNSNIITKMIVWEKETLEKLPISIECYKYERIKNWLHILRKSLEFPWDGELEVEIEWLSTLDLCDPVPDLKEKMITTYTPKNLECALRPILSLEYSISL